jgi:methionyl-tRNA formyltransferase
MRVLFCGSGTFALPTFHAILQSPHELRAVITQPPRPAGRGQTPAPTPIAAQAQQADIETLAVENINDPDVVAQIRAFDAAAMVVAEFGQFVGARARQAVAIDTFNLHGSILPELRGAGPVNWAIIRGYTTTGVSTFSLVDKFDAGDVYLTDETPIGPDERADELRTRLANLGATLVLDTLAALDDGSARRQPQDDLRATFAPKLTKANGHLDFAQPAEALVNRIRGTWPWPGGRALYRRPDGKSFAVTFARAHFDAAPAESAPGTVLPDGRIATAEGTITPAEVKPAGKRLMPWADFCNGYQATAGGSFHHPEATP